MSGWSSRCGARLKLYVEIYYLSEMRVAAFIWMGLVAIGLVADRGQDRTQPRRMPGW